MPAGVTTTTTLAPVPIGADLHTQDVEEPVDDAPRKTRKQLSREARAARVYVVYWRAADETRRAAVGKAMLSELASVQKRHISAARKELERRGLLIPEGEVPAQGGSITLYRVVPL